MPQSSFIDIKNLSVGYTSRNGKIIPVLRDVNLSITRGDSIGLVGESGSGKSTLALAAMGYFKRGLHVISGQVQFDGIDMLNIERNALQFRPVLDPESAHWAADRRSFAPAW